MSVDNYKVYDYIGYLDADLAIPLSEIQHFLYFINRRSETIMAMGCRLIRLGARIDRSFVRHIISRTFATMASRVLGIKVYDTQNGAKLIKSNIVKELFEDEFITRWLFDIELIFRLIKKIGKNEAKRLIVEVPLNECRDIDGSKIKTMDFIRAPLELFKIWRKYG